MRQGAAWGVVALALLAIVLAGWPDAPTAAIQAQGGGDCWHITGSLDPVDLLVEPVACGTTPGPTITPSATWTATPIPPVEATPTPEITTATPFPPAPQTCELIVAVGALNQRVLPDVNAGISGAALAQGTVLHITEFEYGREYLWAHHASGWSAVFDRGLLDWWTYGNHLSANCPNVAGWPGELEPPGAIVQYGIHGQYNASADQLDPLLRVSGIVKSVSDGGRLLDYARAVNPDIVTLYRYVDDEIGNCAPDWMSGSEWIDTLATGYWPPGYDFYEAWNECAEWSRAYSAVFMEEAMDAATARGICLILYSFGVGNPTEAFMRDTGPVLDYAIDHPCQPGRTHVIGMHAYQYRAEYSLDNDYYFDRWARLCRTVPGRCEALGVYITEWGPYPNERDPVVCADEIAAIEWAFERYPGTAVRAILHWAAGPSPVWRDVTGCAGAIARAIAYQQAAR